MFKYLKKRKVVNLKDNCQLDIAIMKTLGNVTISKLEVENNVLLEENKTLELRHQNIFLKNENGLFNRLKQSGRSLLLLALLSCFVSTILSLIGGYLLLDNVIKFSGYALVMVICQLIIFISSRYGTITKDKFIQHYLGLKLMQILMLIISFTMNIMFFHECFNSILMDLIMSPLCFVLDYSTLVFNSLGYDQKTLNFNTKKSNKTIFDMFFDNLTHGFKRKVYKTYYENHPEQEENFIVEVKKNIPEVKQIESKNSINLLEQNKVILDKEFNQVSEEKEDKIFKQTEEEKKKWLDSILDPKEEQIKVIDNQQENSKKTMKLSRKFKNKKFTVKRSNILKFEQKVKPEDKEKVKSVKEDKLSQKLSQKLSRYLNKNYQSGDVIKIKELRERFDLTEAKWKRIKTNLPIESKGTKSFYVGK